MLVLNVNRFPDHEKTLHTSLKNVKCKSQVPRPMETEERNKC